MIMENTMPPIILRNGCFGFEYWAKLQMPHESSSMYVLCEYELIGALLLTFIL